MSPLQLVFFVAIAFVVCAKSHFLAHSHHHHHHHFFDTPPPPQDQCKDVNAAEPPECPKQVGPPCPPCYTNVQSDYVNGDNLKFTTSDQESMNNFTTYYNNWWSDNYPPNKVSNGFGIYSGSAGRALVFLRQYFYTQNATLLDLADQYISTAIRIAPSEQYYSAYMSSHVGVWTIKIIIASIQDDTVSFDKYLSEIMDSYNNVTDAIENNLTSAVNGINMTLYDMETGLTGLFYNGLLINEYFKKDLISPSIILSIAFYVLNNSIATGKSLNTDYLQIPFTFLAGCYLYGPNHGPTGLIHDLYLAYNKYPVEFGPLFTDSMYYDVIKNTLDYYISIQLDDGNMPTQIGGTCYKNYGNDSDERVQFCHGAPGFINVYAQSTIMFAKYNTTAAIEYFNTALVTANVTWQRGLLVKGTMFCHGIGANVNMLWELGQLIDYLQKNGDKAFLNELAQAGYDLEYLKNQSIWRAKQFLLWTLNWSNINKTRIYDSNEGSSMLYIQAIQMLYIQALQDGWPFDEHVCHSGWNLCV